MKSIIILAVFLTASSSFATNKRVIYKHWKIFRSAWGYEFKYPSCWVVEVSSSDEPQTVTPRSRDLIVTETKKCVRPQMAKYVPNGVGISGGWHPLKSIADGDREMKSILTHADNNVIRGTWEVYKQFRFENYNALAWVENMQEASFHQIRWNMEVYCPTQDITFVGPTIKNPDSSYYTKFKAGDLALPEPEKSIYASIRCVTPKKIK